MKRDDSVFFFTLVDFLLTALFFGLVLFAVDRVRAEQSTKSAQEATRKAALADSIVRATGVSDLTELTDELTRLGPVKQARLAVQTIDSAGGLKVAQRAIATVNQAGGADSVAERLERLRRQEGTGKPHCIYTEVAGRKEPIVLARLVGTDSTVSFENETPRLHTLLVRAGEDFASVKSMTFKDFNRTFRRVVELDPGCTYTIEFIERTRFVDARDAARGLFYMRIRK